MSPTKSLKIVVIKEDATVELAVGKEKDAHLILDLPIKYCSYILITAQRLYGREIIYSMSRFYLKLNNTLISCSNFVLHSQYIYHLLISLDHSV